MICFIPDAMKKAAPVITKYFELQITTLFQHAWAQTTHDISYKTTNAKTKKFEKTIAFIAAQVWGADKILEEQVKSEIS